MLSAIGICGICARAAAEPGQAVPCVGGGTAVASPAFGATEPRRTNASHARETIQNGGQIYTVLQKKSDISFYFLEKKNEK